MQVLFRLKRATDFKEPGRAGSLGAAWLEVIAIVAVGISKPEEGSEGWCVNGLVNNYLCRTEIGCVVGDRRGRDGA